MSYKDDLIEIIEICSYVDEKAVEIYRVLSRSAEEEGLKKFWVEMSKEEEEHVFYWVKLLEMARDGMIPQLFDEPDRIKADLENIIAKVESILKESKCKPDVQTSFIIAYRVEFFMASIAYERLFQFLKDVEGKSPTDQYEAHIEKFIKGLSEYGRVTPELEMLSDTLSRLWRENKHLTAQSRKDPLTGVLNRRGFLELATPIIHLAKRKGYLVAVMILDVDKFKRVNDELGHLEGDNILKLVAETLNRAARKSDITGRYGGDEFVMLLYQVDKDSLSSIGERIVNDFRERYEGEFPVSVSVGICYGSIEDTPEEKLERMLVCADNLMYSAKGDSKNKIKIGSI
ncbi:GGDEF domain-containing protein [bacterium]|nr:GGDEF domain-containing protein [bacterium]